MSELRRFIHQRRNTLLQQFRQIQLELAELDRAETALQEANELEVDDTATANFPEGSAEDLTIQQMALFSLDARRQQGGTANQIIEYIDMDFQRSVERTSLSPQLSRLRRAGKILLHEGTYYITPQGAEYIQSLLAEED